MNLKRLWRGLALALALNAALAPVSRADALKLEFWHSMSGEKGKLLQEIVNDFNSRPENQGKLSVRLQFVGSYEEGLNKLRTALIAGRGPHVVQITDVGTQVMIDSGSIRPLQDFISGDPEFPIRLLLPQIRHYYEIHGKLYSLPFATSNPILYYNADQFEKAGLKKAPETFSELEEWARKLTHSETKTTGITWPLHSWFFEQFLAKQGMPLVNEDNGRKARATQVNYLAPEAVGFVSLWAKMAKEGIFANVGRGWDPAEQNFLAGRSAMLITSTSDVFEVMKQVPFKLGTASIPGATAHDKGGTVIGGNSLWILNTKPEAEQRAAYSFIKFMASKPIQTRWHQNTGYFPIRSDVIDELKAAGFYVKYPAAWTAIEQLRHSPDIPATRGALIGAFAEVREQIESAIEEVLSGWADVPTALARAKARSEFSLTRYNRGRPNGN